MDVAGPAIATTAVLVSVLVLAVVALPVAFAIACWCASRIETDPADPWRLARRFAQPDPQVEDWRLALEARLRRTLPYVSTLEADVTVRYSEVDTLNYLMYGERDRVPVVHGRGR